MATRPAPAEPPAWEGPDDIHPEAAGAGRPDADPGMRQASPDDAQPADDWTADVPDMPDDFEPSASAGAILDDDGDLSIRVALPGIEAGTVADVPDPARLAAADWPALAADLPVTGAARALALNSEWLGGDEHQIRLRVAIHTLTEGGAHDRLRTVLSEYFGRVLRLDVEYGSTGSDTAYAVDQAAQARRQQAAEDAAQGDGLVQALAGRFAARVVPGSVRPPAV